MMPAIPDTPHLTSPLLGEEKLLNIKRRAAIVRSLRAFFDQRDYLEADTPLMADNLIPESCLEVFETEQIVPRGLDALRRQKKYLIPSPEIHLKKLIGQARVNVYEICKCFRNSEQEGSIHNPEFTMLEYYTLGFNYLDSLGLTEELFAELCDRTGNKSLRPPFIRMTMDEAFREYAGFSLDEALLNHSLREKAREKGITGPYTDAVFFDLVFVQEVEPRLPKDRPLALLDYPGLVPCLAKNKDESHKERWELYAGSVELANCYTEETDPDAVRVFFQAEAAEKARNALVPHAIDPDYWKNFRACKQEDGSLLPYPACSGVALGVDRLVMALLGCRTIQETLLL
jgi:lysyl-tRNA synthetase class 2